MMEIRPIRHDELDAAVARGSGGAVKHRVGALAERESWLWIPDEPWCPTTC